MPNTNVPTVQYNVLIKTFQKHSTRHKAVTYKSTGIYTERDTCISEILLSDRLITIIPKLPGL